MDSVSIKWHILGTKILHKLEVIGMWQVVSVNAIKIQLLLFVP